MSYYEFHKRSLLKSVSFRAAVLLSDFVIVFLITHRYDAALLVIVATNLASTVLYYFHERIWSRIGWGRNI